jgi:thiamine biosynthesis lipoprotein
LTATTLSDYVDSQLIYRTSVWSTRVELVVTEPGALVVATAILHDELCRVDRVANRFRRDSELNALHNAARSGSRVPVSADLLEALVVALRAAALSDGAVDPTVGAAMCRLGYDRDFSLVAPSVEGSLPEPCPVQGWRSVAIDVACSTVRMPAGTVLDLGATAKAWAADRASEAIASRLGCGVLVSLGGDLAVRGTPQGGFRVGLADVCGDPSSSLTVAISSGGLATSGIGSRHWSLGGNPVHHLVDPGTGLPVDPYWRTVTVAAGSCVDANTASTSAMIKGRVAIDWLEERNLPARLVGLDGSATAIAGWPPDHADDRPFERQSG